MEIHELVSKQGAWEAQRGIQNSNWGIDRIQVELNEAREAENLGRMMWELADVMIITAGAIAQIANVIESPPNEIENIISLKQDINDLKYPAEVFVGRDWQAAVTLCRALWEQK